MNKKINGLDSFKEALSKFQILSDDDFNLAYPFLNSLKLAKKEYFINFNQKVTQVGFIVKGFFRTYYINDKGNEITTCFCYENGFINTMPVSTSQINTPCAIQAIEPSELIVISLKDMDKLFSQSNNWLMLAYKTTQMGLMNWFNFATNISEKEAFEKYDEFIKQNPSILNRVPLQYLASYLGISKETLSRVRKKQTH